MAYNIGLHMFRGDKKNIILQFPAFEGPVCCEQRLLKTE